MIKAHSWIEVSASALAQNVALLRKNLAPACLLAPCVKANAYGHGLQLSALQLVEAGVDWLCVTELQEAKALRVAGVQIPLLVIGSVFAEELVELAELDVRVCVDSTAFCSTIRQLSKAHPLKLHLHINTGMGRQGVEPEHALSACAELVQSGAVLEGLCTHFSQADELIGALKTDQQLKIFQQVSGDLRDKFPQIQYLHAANTGGIWFSPAAQLNFVRPGLAIYGYPTQNMPAAILTKLQPALTWKTHVAELQHLPAGATIGYGSTFTCQRSSTIAVLPIGYADGYSRSWSNQASVLIRGKRCPVVGRVSMNLVTADVTELPSVSIEDEVVLIGAQGTETVRADELAQLSQAIPYEVLTQLRESIPRILVD